MDTPQTSSSVPQPGVKPVQGVDTAQASFSVAQQAVQNTGQFLQQSIQQQSQMTNQMTQSNIAVTQAQAQAETTQAATNKDNFGTVLAGLGNTASGVAKVLEYVDKRDQAMREAQYDQEFAQASSEVEQLKSVASSRAMGTPEGRQGLERDFQNILSKRKLRSEDAAKLYGSWYGKVQEIDGEYARRQRSEMDKVQDAQREEARAKLEILLSNKVSQVAAATDPGEVNKNLEELNKVLQTVYEDKNLDTRTKAELLAHGYKVIAGGVWKSTDAQAKTQKQLQNWDEFSKAAVDIERRKQAGELDEAQANRERVIAAERLSIPASIASTYDPLEMRKRTNSIMKTEQEEYELRKTGDLIDYDNTPLSSMARGSIAWDLAVSPDAEAQYRAQMGDTAQGKAVLAIVDTYKEYRKRKQELAEKEAAWQTAKNKIALDDAQEFYSFLKTLKPETAKQVADTVGLGGLLSTEAQALKAKADAGDEQARREWEARLTEARGILTNRRRDIMDGIDRERDAMYRDVEAREKQLEQYGFKTGTFDPQTYQRAVDERNQAMMKREASRRAREQSTYGGQQPGFNSPRLHTATVRGGKKAVLPIPQGTQVTTWDNYGQDRGTHRHQGEDLAVSKGTPIIAAMGGRVTRVDKTSDPDGYGYFVEVQLDDGTYHLFAHLSSIDVKRGQRVVPGQVIAKSGGVPGEPGSGRTTGAHIHWEVRDKSERVIDPYAWATTVQLNTPSKAARSGDNRQERPSNIPKDAIPVKGGYLVRDSQGKSKYVPYGSTEQKDTNYKASSPLRANNNSTNIADYPKRNNPTANYGYAVLAQDKQFARTLAETSDRLGIPAQWLADVMAYETGGTFDPSVQNKGGAPAYGLIQFYEDEDRPGGKTIGGRWYSFGELRAMSRTQQMKLVEQYLVPFKGKMREPRHVLGAVFGYDPNLSNSASDGDISMGEYLDELGSHAGRRYYNNKGSNRVSRMFGEIDNKPNHDCTLCRQMLAAGTWVPHESLA
ncbi:MAG: peptidoglycan DD-metalloendopeptidase family protein [Leptolyngbya sp. UWPOB_LEPTO1]|uniref:M23 family metallopeptidase n=1 Tax=Leptolyngbya sp. UWPOB_LEPTO1 TaxID=2815653 RepID=UPI001AD48688|nr:M23 family metallopeptidase [Leptolyngbya sp. UWPOB_LEPTO1]MBN8559489.1 peptidoglycan DD-metalloendopeptidase family protein [Leptolyngbya sp. UWPOB_LEPTO1]